MWLSRRGRLLATIAALPMALPLVSAGPASAWEFVTGPPRESAVSWNLSRPPGGDGRRIVSLHVVTGYCLGEPPPVAGPVEVVERPISAVYPRPTAIITAHQILPKPTEVSGKVLPGEPIPVCEGLGYDFEKRVRLKRPVAGMTFFDGSFDPPRRVKPLHAR